MHGGIELTRDEGLWRGRFHAMASPCEVLIETGSGKLAREMVQLAADEAWRVERTFSRYRDDNIVHRINHANGAPVTVDGETARLFDFAQQCHELSNGLFDVTSGVLRRAWTFDGGQAMPNAELIESLLPLVGWHKVAWRSPGVRMPAGMEIDFGGIGKEYAVDRCQQLLSQHSTAPALVNLGGDLAVTGNRNDAAAWRAGVENPDTHAAAGAIEISQGALATSGDTYRFVLQAGVRYGHILDPRSGWPIANAPRSVTVAAPNCTQAGMLATFAMLQGADAESFLAEQQLPHWCLR